MRPSLIALGALLASSCASTPGPPLARRDAQVPAAPCELWVDAHASAEPADGSKTRPLRDLGEALRRAVGPCRVRLASGLYAGPFEIPDGVTVEGAHATVLHAEAPATVVTLGTSAALQSLTVQGGDVGVFLRGGGRLQRVHLSGFRKTAVHVPAQAKLEATGLDVLGSVSESLGVRVDTAAAAVIERSVFRGGLRDAISAQPRSHLEVRDSRFDGPVHAVRTLGAKVQVRSTTIENGRGAALWLSGGEATLHDVRVLGHEYGLLASEGIELRVTDFTSLKPERAGLALVDARAQLDGILVVEAGTYGGLQIVGGDLRLRSFVVAGAREWGLQLFGATADVANGVITRIEEATPGSGDGVHVRRGKVRLASLTIQRTAGSGVFVAEHASVAARDLFLENTRWAGVVVDSAAHLEAASIFVRRSKGTALAVPGNATAKIDLLLSAENAEGDLWVDCAQGAEVRLGRLKSTRPSPIVSSCVGAWETPVVFDPLASP